MSRGGARIAYCVHLRMKMTNSPRFLVFLVLLTILSTERCCGQSGNCPYRYCSHTATLACGSGGLVRLPCVVYNATGPIQVRWYHSQKKHSADAEELNVTTGGRYTVEESNSRYANCTEDQLYRHEITFNYSDGDSGLYWCRIVIGGDTPLEFSEPWKVQMLSGASVCGPSSQTDTKCVGQIATTPGLPPTFLLAQSTPTSVMDPSPVSVATQSPIQTPGAPRSIPPSVATQSPIQTPGAPRSTPLSVATQTPIQTPGAPCSTPPSVATQTPGAPRSTPLSVATQTPIQTPGAPCSTPPSVATQSPIQTPGAPHSIPPSVATHSPIQTPGAPHSTPPSVVTPSPIQTPGAPHGTPPSVVTPSPIQTPGAPHGTPPSVVTPSPIQTPGAPHGTPPSVVTPSPIQTPSAPHSIPPSVATHSPIQTPGAPHGTPPSVVTQSPIQTPSAPHGTPLSVAPIQTPGAPMHSIFPSVATSGVPSGTSPSSDAATGCTLSGVSCFVYLGIGLGALAVIVVLLLVVIIVLVCISVKRGRKMQGENIVAESSEMTELLKHPKVSVENSVGYAGVTQGSDKNTQSNEYEEIDQGDRGKRYFEFPASQTGSQMSTNALKEEIHTYDAVAQPTGGNTEQQHIYDRTQHPGIGDKTQQTRDEYNQDNTTGHGQYEHLDNTRQGNRNKEARSEGHYYDSVSITEQEKHHGTGTLSSQENIYHVLEGPTEENSSVTTAAEDMYSTPNFSSKRPPQSPSTLDNFYHVLEGPNPSLGSSPERSTAPGKEEENEYDEPVHPNWDSNKSDQQLGGELFDDPSYQSTTAQSNQESKKRTWDGTRAFSQDSKNAQEDDYDQPAAITVKNKELNSNEGEDQPVLFDDPTYQATSAPV